MTRLFAVSLFLFAFGLGCVAASVAQNFVVPPVRAGTSPARWEYKCQATKMWNGKLPDDTEQKLNAMGAAGWELVDGLGGIQFCFKRPL